MSKQPRTVHLEEQGAAPPDTYRAGLHLERQRFGDSKRDKLCQDLFSLDGVEGASSGITLTVPEERALEAVLYLLDKRTDYHGDTEIFPGDTGYKWNKTVPQMQVSHTDYFEVCGLKRYGGRFHGKRKEEAAEALLNLSTKRYAIFYPRVYIHRGKEVTDIIKVTGTVLNVINGSRYERLTETEAAQVRAGQKPPPGKVREGVFIITASPLIVDQVFSSHIVKTLRLREAIQKALDKRKISQSTPLFINYLLTIDKETFRVNKDTLINRLRLQADIDSRHWDRIEKKLEEAFRAAELLGYITQPPTMDRLGCYTFHLHPEKCTRIQAKQKRLEDRAKPTAIKKGRRRGK